MQQRTHFPSQPAALADRVLVRQTLAGDEDAFETLVRRYHTPVFHFICHYVSDYDQACDVFQQVLLKLSACLPKLCIPTGCATSLILELERHCVNIALIEA
jgi:DNA-directed RNA polymerase specialized sigma24 family protein